MTYNEVYIKVDDIKNVDKICDTLKEEGYQISSMVDYRKQMQQQTAQRQLRLAGLAAISLFVAALNIANTMTMAIYERTREIGVMKVLGCEIGNIRRMFLIESGMIGFIGGVAGTIFVHKIAGAKAEQGASLADVKSVAEKVVANVRSMGMAIEPCTVPAAGKPGFELAEDEMEIGIGIHGEPGTHREKMRPANEIAKMLVDQILADLDYKGHEVVVLINGMGGTPLMELYIVNNFVQDYLKEQGISVYDTMVGNYMTSIEMAGFSITLLRRG